MVLYKDACGNSALFVAKSALSNHNETPALLSLFGGSITTSCTELLFNFISLRLAVLRLQAQQGLRLRRVLQGGGAQAVCCQAPL